MNRPPASRAVPVRRNGSRKGGNSVRGWRRVHRWIGLALALVLLIIAVTGILLNHAAELRLQRTRLGGPIAALYVEPPARPPRAARLDDGRWVVWIDGHLYRQGREMQGRLDSLVGAVETPDGFAVAGAHALLLFDDAGRLVERLGEESLPGPIARIGRDREGRLLILSQGRVRRADAVMLDWQDVGPAQGMRGNGMRWSRADEEMPTMVRKRALAARSGAGVSLSRLLIDLHTGRIFGRLGRWAGDLAAIGLILLALTGIVTWAKTRRARRERRAENGHRPSVARQ
ncbi:MAG: PepSY domain-containing protein [Alphaproteobacteria bacterium]|nr:MAG: PepSY domain-containing protein [Alphaproteobacteria bacterium]